MRDAMGGIFNIAFLAVFITVISGYLAFSVSYNKAFKVKNKAISVLEQYQHYNTESEGKIRSYIRELGYNTKDVPATKLQGYRNEGFTCPEELGICYKWTNTTDAGTGINKGYYSVIAFVNVSIPIFNKFLPYLSFFQTRGDTMTINTTN